MQYKIRQLKVCDDVQSERESNIVTTERSISSFVADDILMANTYNLQVVTISR